MDSTMAPWVESITTWIILAISVAVLLLLIAILSVLLRRKPPKNSNFPLQKRNSGYARQPAQTTFTPKTDSRPPISHWENDSHDTKFKYRKKPFLMTKNELAFYKELEPIANKKHLNTFSKIRIADLIEPQIPREAPGWDDAFYKICFKHVDFVLCDMEFNRPLIAIELDDKTHMKDHRDNRDIFVDSAFQSAGIPILHTLSTIGLDKKIDEAMNTQ